MGYHSSPASLSTSARSSHHSPFPQCDIHKSASVFSECSNNSQRSFVLTTFCQILQRWALRSINSQRKIVVCKRIHLITVCCIEIVLPVRMGFFAPRLQNWNIWLHVIVVQMRLRLLNALVSEDANVPDARTSFANEDRRSRGDGVHGTATEAGERAALA